MLKNKHKKCAVRYPCIPCWSWTKQCVTERRTDKQLKWSPCVSLSPVSQASQKWNSVSATPNCKQSIVCCCSLTCECIVEHPQLTIIMFHYILQQFLWVNWLPLLWFYWLKYNKNQPIKIMLQIWILFSHKMKMCWTGQSGCINEQKMLFLFFKFERREVATKKHVAINLKEHCLYNIYLSTL